MLNLFKNRLNNEFYNINSYFSIADSVELAHYRRILKRRIYGHGYLRDICDQDLINQAVKRLFGTCPFCPDCEQPTTTETSSTDPNTSTTSTSTSGTMTSTMTLTTSFSGSSTTTTTTTEAFIELPTTLPQILCADPGEFSGGQIFPSVQEVVLGSSLGTVEFNFNAFNIPDKYLVVFDGQVVIDTGYRGNTSYQTALNNALTVRGLPHETIAGPGSGTDSFVKSSVTTSAFVYIYAPLANTAWNYTLECPI